MCELSEIVWFLGGTSVTNSISMIGLERVITTIWKRKFFDHDRPSTIAHVMAFMIWASSSGMFFLNLALAYFDEKPLCYCFGMFTIPAWMTFAFSPVFMIMEISTILCFLVLYYMSRSSYLDFTINTTRHCLAERHQLLSNMETSSLLAPVMINHGLVYSGVVISLSYTKLAVDDFPTKIIIANVVLTVQALETVLHPILLLIKHKNMRRAALHYFPFLKRFEKSGGGETAVTRVKSIGADRIYKNGRAGCSSGLVDFRVKPEDNDNILNTVWDSKMRTSQKRVQKKA